MLFLQLLIFSVLFLGFGIFSVVRKKTVIGITFSGLGLMLLAVALIAIYLYPEKWIF